MRETQRRFCTLISVIFFCEREPWRRLRALALLCEVAQSNCPGDEVQWRWTLFPSPLCPAACASDRSLFVGVLLVASPLSLACARSKRQSDAMSSRSKMPRATPRKHVSFSDLLHRIIVLGRQKVWRGLCVALACSPCPALPALLALHVLSLAV